MNRCDGGEARFVSFFKHVSAGTLSLVTPERRCVNLLQRTVVETCQQIFPGEKTAEKGKKPQVKGCLFCSP
ncbi:hypothetical protein ILYODFUR_033664 [Ilyodon furcidens]|uniref:Uncharacterized protein n=1 Tax=Ilyodon furcidens TaxID=33524 RepID=A0ABV0VJD3_9TELE